MQLPEYINKRKKNKNGFTLAETLMAMLILLMVSGIIAAGIPVAKDAYTKVVRVSNAEVLLSTTVSTLRNELGTATSVERTTADGEGYTNYTITYFNGTRRSSARIYFKNGDEVWLQRYYGDNIDPSVKESEPEKLMSSTVSTKDMIVTCDSVSYSNGIITFNNVAVKAGSDTLTSRTVSIRVISGN